MSERNMNLPKLIYPHWRGFSESVTRAQNTDSL